MCTRVVTCGGVNGDGLWPRWRCRWKPYLFVGVFWSLDFVCYLTWNKSINLNTWQLFIGWVDH
jgi:hypothetical protein